jgi:hypothetical protein
MIQYYCDKCGEKIMSYYSKTKIITHLGVIEMDLCKNCKDKCQKDANKLKELRSKEDETFLERLKEKVCVK